MVFPGKPRITYETKKFGRLNDVKRSSFNLNIYVGRNKFAGWAKYHDVGFINV
jgi:hypothetical protein